MCIMVLVAAIFGSGFVGDGAKMSGLTPGAFCGRSQSGLISTESLLVWPSYILYTLQTASHPSLSSYIELSRVFLAKMKEV